MKTKPTILPASPAATPQNWEILTDEPRPLSPMAPSPMPSETLLNLGAIVAGLQLASIMGDENEQKTSQPVIAGIVVALAEILPIQQFKQVMVQWEIDQFNLIKLFEYAGFDGSDPKIQALI